MTTPLTIAIAGCAGRMGQTLMRAARANAAVALVAGSERHPAAVIENAEGVFITSDPALLAEKAEAVIDFTAPEATLAIASAIAQRGGIHIIGTTGFSQEQQRELKNYSTKARIVQSGNFSLGINLLERLVEQAARTLGTDYDIEIAEMHHKHKKDAPSGTALMLGRAAAEGRGIRLEEKMVTDRQGERKTGDIGFSVQRGGDVVGIHSVLFAGPGELIELKHQGFSREIYANGALHAALWAAKQKPGLYCMRDVLGSMSS